MEMGQSTPVSKTEINLQLAVLLHQKAVSKQQWSGKERIVCIAPLIALGHIMSA